MLGNVVLRRGEPAAGLLPAAGGVCVRVCVCVVEAPLSRVGYRRGFPAPSWLFLKEAAKGWSLKEPGSLLRAFLIPTPAGQTLLRLC